MMTPQEVQACTFVKALFGGYDMASVDDFLDRLTEDYAALYKENALLKNKLKVLVSTVEEYRSVDEEMRKALANAKKSADAIISEAKRTRESMMADAHLATGELRARIESETAGEERKLRAARKNTATFLGDLRTLLLDQVAQIETFAKSSPPPEREGRVADVAAEVQAAVATQLNADEFPAAPVETDPPPETADEPAVPQEEPLPERPKPVIHIEEITLGQGVRLLTEDDLRTLGEEKEEDTVVPPVREDFDDLTGFGKG
jgi:cell division initiation protein